MTKKPLVTGGGLWNPAHPTSVYEEAFDPNDCGEWVMVEDTVDFRRYELHLGEGRYIQRTEAKGTELLLKENEELRKLNADKKWGDGDVVGRVPLDLYFSSGLAEAAKNKDRKFQQKWWDKSENRKWRTRGGTL